MMNSELYIRSCAECHKIFRTDDPDQKLCPDCLKFRGPHLSRRKKSRKKKAPKKILTFAEILHIAEVYAKVNNRYLHYGDMVALIDSSNADHCVCCGAIVPEGRQVCPQCERMVE